MLKVKPLKCPRGSGLDAKEAEERGKGRAEHCSRGELRWWDTQPCSAPRQHHALLQMLLVLYNTSIRRPPGFGVSTVINYVNAVIIRAVKREGGKCMLKSLVKTKAWFHFFNSRLDLVVIVFEAISFYFQGVSSMTHQNCVHCHYFQTTMWERTELSLLLQ